MRVVLAAGLGLVASVWGLTWIAELLYRLFTSKYVPEFVSQTAPDGVAPIALSAVIAILFLMGFVVMEFFFDEKGGKR